MSFLLRGLALSLLLSTTASAQNQAIRAGSPAQAEVVTALNAPAGAVSTANAMLTREADQLFPCMVGGEDGPWMFRLDLRNGRVRSAELVSGGSEADSPTATRLTTCVEGVLQTLRFRRLGASIEVRVSKQQIFGLGPTDTIGGLVSRTRARARIRPGRPDVRGGLAQEIVRRVVRRHLVELRYCYQRALGQNPDLQGALTIQFVISATGTVPRASTSDVEAGLEPVAACFAQATRRWTFPAPTNAGVVVVVYPFVLSPPT